MDGYAAWGSRVMHGTRRSPPPPPPHDIHPATSVGTAPPLPPQPPQPLLPSAAGSFSYLPASSAVAAPPLSPSLPVGDSFSMSSFNLLGSVADEPAGTVTRLQEVLRDICATERRQEKTWLNVQPCVLHAVKLLAATAQMHAVRVRQMEDVLQQLQQYTAVLVRDREVKEERYRLDAAAHREEADELRKRLLRLETQQQVSPRQLDQLTPEAVMARLEETVEARVAPLQQELLHLRQQLKALAPSRPLTPLHHRRARSRSLASASSTLPVRNDYCVGGGSATASSSSSAFLSSLASLTTPSPGRRGEAAVTDAAAFTPHCSPHALGSAAAASAGTQKMMCEVQRLRRQWRHFLQSLPPGALAEDKGSSGGSDGGRNRHDTTRFPSHRQPRSTSKSVSRNSAGRVSGLPRTSEEDAEGTRENAPQPLHLSARHSPLLAPKDVRAASVSSALPASGRRVRWYWSGDAQSHFSTAVRRAKNGFAASLLPNARPHAALSGVSPALPWTECHAFDGRSGCWYSLGTWATHRRRLREVKQALVEGASGESHDVRLGWMAWASSLVSWPEASTMLVERAGIYVVRVCLVRHCASASLCSGAGRAEAGSRGDCCGGALTLWLDGVAVAGMQEVVTHALLYARVAASPAEAAVPWRATQGKARSTCASRGSCLSTFDGGAYSPVSASFGGSPAQRRARGDIWDATQRQRPCCEPAQLHTNTLTACLFLPTGVTLQVRCRGLHDTKTVHEAFFELEYVV
ncbi:hypothetical protein LSCM4_00856 [Leishmania orientalis]|uniref:Uncharacterized protein n=1 Tax=Leishmania orientalis TaxID=2249476 RepID=A0A836FRF3_9TRYP|nr:hypothetical protein LSCM4_00856 [Leishmania orientalis]